MLIPNKKAIEIVDPGNGNAHIAWGHAVQGSGGIDQVQRWFFAGYADVKALRADMPPHKSWIWKTTQTNLFDETDENSFIAYVKDKAGVFGKANCVHYQNQNVPPAGTFPDPPLPATNGGNQNDGGTLHVLMNGVLVADAFAEWYSTKESHEAWALRPAYPATGQWSAMTVDKIDYSNFQSYLKDALWTTQWKMVLANLRYYDTYPQGW